MKTLHLPLKAKWYDMIECGVKNEEYRELKPYWKKRICTTCDVARDENYTFCNEVRHNCEQLCLSGITHVCFSYGYTKRRMTYEAESITIGRGKPEWGAPTVRPVFIIKLGHRIKEVRP